MTVRLYSQRKNIVNQLVHVILLMKRVQVSALTVIYNSNTFQDEINCLQTGINITCHNTKHIAKVMWC